MALHTIDHYDLMSVLDQEIPDAWLEVDRYDDHPFDHHEAAYNEMLMDGGDL